MQKGSESLARKVLDLAAEQGLLEPKAIAELRQRVAASKFIITPEAIAKVLVDHGHLTPFQARKLVGQALGPEPEPAPPQRRSAAPVEELTFADPNDIAEQAANTAAAEEDDIVELEAVALPPAPAKPSGKQPARRPAAAEPPLTMIWRAWAPRSRAESGKAIRARVPLRSPRLRAPRSPPPGLQRLRLLRPASPSWMTG
jgi:hypothetical protein